MASIIPSSSSPFHASIILSSSSPSQSSITLSSSSPSQDSIILSSSFPSKVNILSSPQASITLSSPSSPSQASIILSPSSPSREKERVCSLAELMQVRDWEKRPVQALLRDFAVREPRHALPRMTSSKSQCRSTNAYQSQQQDT